MKFRALHNPNFNLASVHLAKPIQFKGGKYETDDISEIKALQRHAAVEQVTETAQRPSEPNKDDKPERVPAKFHTGGIVPGPNKPPLKPIVQTKPFVQTKAVGDVGEDDPAESS